MSRRWRQILTAVIIMLALIVPGAVTVCASDDNSLASLGIKTQGVSVSPEFKYDVWEYSVEVPAGTKELELEPHTTNPNAEVNSVTGTTLSEDGTGRVVITVTSESGNAIEYVLNVSAARKPIDPAEIAAANESSVAATIDTEVRQSEVETEDPRYVKVDRNSLQDAENTIEKLQNTITEQRSHINMLTYVLYALIAVSIIFLFIVISQLLRSRDMAQELAFYKHEDPYNDGTGAVGDDGWGDWGEDDLDRSRKKKKKKSAEEDGWEDDPADTADSWMSQQVGTPVRPQNHPARSRQYNGPADRSRQYNGPADRGRQYNGPADRSRQYHGPADETRRYDAVKQTRQPDIPRDVTKDLNRVNKAEAKAMKKAAAAEAKRAQEAQRQAQEAQGARVPEAQRQAQEAQRQAQEAQGARVPEAQRQAQEAERARVPEAERARAQEAQRQAQEAERIAREQEAMRRAQEQAIDQAAGRHSEQETPESASGAKGENVKINMIDL